LYPAILKTHRAIQLKMYKTLIKYIAKNKFISVTGFYFLFSAVFKAVTEIDICIPCIWKFLFGFHCPGCGLTTALISIIKLDFNNAIETKSLIFVILPFGFYYMAQDYFKFSRK
jgi:hypothetical protein